MRYQRRESHIEAFRFDGTTTWNKDCPAWVREYGDFQLKAVDSGELQLLVYHLGITETCRPGDYLIFSDLSVRVFIKQNFEGLYKAVGNNVRAAYTHEDISAVILFIGGPKDGESMRVPENQDYVNVPERDTEQYKVLDAVEVYPRVYTYRRHWLPMRTPGCLYSDRRFSVFVHTEMDFETAFLRLLNNYLPEKP